MLALPVSLVAACGPSDPMPSSKHSTVPAHAVNDASLGVIRVRFDRSSSGSQASRRQALQNWMSKNGLDCPRIDYLLNQLEAAGFDTLLAVIPGDDAILDDAGMYVGGPAAKSSEDLEDVLIKVGGFSIGGLAASKLQVISIGNGWHYVGINGDGVIDGASSSAAARMSRILELVGDRPACAVVPIEGLDDAIADIAPGDQSRLIRRVRQVASALDDAVALAAAVTADGGSEVIIVFPTEREAAALDMAFSGIRKDMELALQGSIEQGKVSLEEAERERRMIAALRSTHRGRTVVLYERPAEDESRR
jgi:hypothetical protein